MIFSQKDSSAPSDNPVARAPLQRHSIVQVEYVPLRLECVEGAPGMVRQACPEPANYAILGPAIYCCKTL